MRSRAFDTAAAVAALALAAPVLARGQATSIAPDVGSPAAVGTVATRNGSVISIDGGAVAGANLFHSFSQFSLGAGDTAQWVRGQGGAGVIRNVINRVTGGQPSQIAGAIDSTAFANASFFFINPAGIVFTAGAQVNVPGAAYFSTANEVRFEGGGRFAVATPSGSTLSVAAPAGFGFVGGQGEVSVSGAGPGFMLAGSSLSLSGSDVEISGSRIAAQGLDLLAVGGGAGDMTLAAPLAAAPNAESGAISIRSSQLLVAPGVAAGPLRIRGGGVTLDGATLVSDTTGPARGGDIQISADRLLLTHSPVVAASAHGAGDGGGIVITARSVEGDSGLLSSLTQGAGAGGRISLLAGSLDLSQVTLGSNGTSTGTGGAISIAATTLQFDTVNVVANALGSGQGGAIAISAAQTDIGAGVIFTSAAGTGRPGDVALQGSRISINGASLGSAPGFNAGAGSLSITADASLDVTGGILSAVAYGDFTSGTIAISSPKIHFDGAFLDSQSIGAGAVGVIDIRGQSIIFDKSRVNAVARGDVGTKLGLVQIKASSDLLINLSQIDSSAEGRAQGGAIALQGGRITLDASQVAADSNGQGRGGRIDVTADTLRVTNSQLTSKSVVAGDAGDVSLQAATISLETGSLVSSETDSLEGDAGSVAIRGGKLTLEDSQVTSSAAGGFGRAGTVSVNVESLSLTDATISSDALSLGDGGDIDIHVAGTLDLLGNRRPFTSISSNTFSEGAAGAVSITAGVLNVRDQAFVSSQTQGNGNAGKVSVTAGALRLTNGGSVQTDSLGNGVAGDVAIKADTLTVDGSGDDRAPTFISSDSLGDGAAGRVVIDAVALSVLHDGFISSDTFVGGNAGDLTITAKTLTLQDNAAIVSQAFPGSGGNAGRISIAAGDVAVRDRSLISTSSFGDGMAGAVIIAAKGNLTLDGSRISSSAETGARGASGTLSITAGELSVVNQGVIATVSNSTPRAGQIDIAARAITIDGKGAAISSENQAGDAALGNVAGERGDAGGVNLAAERITISNGAKLSTNSFAGAAGEIGIAISPSGILVLEGAKAPGSIETSSGAGTGGRISIAAPRAVISNGGSILALGELRGANVVIQSRYFISSTDRANTVDVAGEFKLVTGAYDVSSGTVSRDLSVLDASKVLRGQCPAARSTGQVSQLISRPVGPYAPGTSREADPTSTERLAPQPGVCR